MAETLDDIFESEAAAQRAKAIKDENDPAYQARAKAKREAEQAKIDAGITALTPEESPPRKATTTTTTTNRKLKQEPG